MLLTVIRLNHVDPRKSLLQCAYGHLTDARDSRFTVKYRAHHVRLQVFTPRNHDSRRKMKLVGLHINLALVHACDCTHSVRLKNGGRDVPAAPSSDGFASAFGALTALPDDDAAAPPSTAGESSTGTHNQRPGAGLAASVPGAHAGASGADVSAGTGATCTARALVYRVSCVERRWLQQLLLLTSPTRRLLCPCPGTHHPARACSRPRGTTRRTTP